MLPYYQVVDFKITSSCTLDNITGRDCRILFMNKAEQYPLNNSVRMLVSINHLVAADIAINVYL